MSQYNEKLFRRVTIEELKSIASETGNRKKYEEAAYIAWSDWVDNQRGVKRGNPGIGMPFADYKDAEVGIKKFDNLSEEERELLVLKTYANLFGYFIV